MGALETARRDVGRRRHRVVPRFAVGMTRRLHRSHAGPSASAAQAAPVGGLGEVAKHQLGWRCFGTAGKPAPSCPFAVRGLLVVCLCAVRGGTGGAGESAGSPPLSLRGWRSSPRGRCIRPFGGGALGPLGGRAWGRTGSFWSAVDEVVVHKRRVFGLGATVEPAGSSDPAGDLRIRQAGSSDPAARPGCAAVYKRAPSGAGFGLGVVHARGKATFSNSKRSPGVVTSLVLSGTSRPRAVAGWLGRVRAHGLPWSRFYGDRVDKCPGGL